MQTVIYEGWQFFKSDIGKWSCAICKICRSMTGFWPFLDPCSLTYLSTLPKQNSRLKKLRFYIFVHSTLWLSVVITTGLIQFKKKDFLSPRTNISDCSLKKVGVSAYCILVSFGIRSVKKMLLVTCSDLMEELRKGLSQSTYLSVCL